MGISKAKKIVIIGAFIIALVFFFDDAVDSAFVYLRSDLLTSLMHFITDFGLLFLIILIGAICILRKKMRFLMFMILCGMIAFEAAFLFKLIFHVPRPYVLGYEEPIFLASGYAFPSIHAAFVSAILPFQKHIFNKRSLIFVYAVMLLILISRIYLGVHSASDIVFGIVIGLTATYTFLGAESKYNLTQWVISKVTDKFELRRQTAHLFVGMSIVFLLKLQLLNTYILFVITIAGGIIVLLARKVRIPFVHDVLEYFERPHHIARFPGRGSFFMVLGAALSTMIFSADIAMAAILVMAVGDSVTNIVGRHFGKIQNPFNSKKNLEGTGFAIVTSTLAALFFVPFGAAFWGATISMIVESLDIGWRSKGIEIDDNVIIPLVAGAIMTILA